MDEKIAEMAKVIKNTWLVNLDGDTFDVSEFLDEVDIKSIATELYDVGYRKESDTARKLAKTIKSVIWEEWENETIRIKDLHSVIDDILRCNYGVKIED